MTTYEPGTVADITIRSAGKPERAIRTGSDGWRTATMFYGDEREDAVTDVRPLVVLDPKGHPEATDQFMPAHFRSYAETLREVRGPQSVAALELEFIAKQIEEQTQDPKPDEPHGRYAVVEDRDGVEWCKIDPSNGETYVWQQLGKPGGADVLYQSWDELDVVKILSPGASS